MFVALLMAGCGEDSEWFAEDTPESNQTSLAIPATKKHQVGKIDLGDAETQKIIAEAIDYKKITDDYTGWAKRIWDNGQIKALGQINDGKEEGLWTEWYESGNKLTEVNYKDGKMEGVGTLWYENGKKQTESNYKNGKHNGLWKHWFENGQKKGEGNFKDGKPNGLATLWYENGQKQRETNFKNGESMPLVWTAFVWKPNGEKCSITNINNGNGILVDYYEDGTEKNRLTFKDGIPVIN